MLEDARRNIDLDKRFRSLKDAQRQIGSYSIKGERVYHHGEDIGKLRGVTQRGWTSPRGRRYKNIAIEVDLEEGSSWAPKDETPSES